MPAISAAPIIPAHSSRDQVQSLLRSPRRVLACNQALYERAVKALEAPNSQASREQRIEELKRIFGEFQTQGRGALPDQAPVPSRIRQQIINRIHQRITAQSWALDYCDAQEVGYGEQLAYRVQGVKLPKVYKLAEPGGNWVEIHRNRDGVFTLGDPIVYTIPEIWIPRWDPLYPDRYLEDIAYVADVAAIAMSEQIDADAVTAVTNQVVASGMRSNAFDWISSRVVSASVPDTNDLDASDNDKIDLNFFKTLGGHALKLNRRIARIDIDPDGLMTMWDAVETGSNFPALPESFRAQVLRDGEDAYFQLFGIQFPIPKPNNTIDNTGSTKYAWALLDPPAKMLAPRGAAWLYTWPAPEDLGQSGQAYVVDNLQYLRTETRGPRVYDVFVLMKNVLFTSVAYQQPNVVRIKYAS